VGLEPSRLAIVSPLDRFFAAISPFFCRGAFASLKGLAGDEKNERKNREMPLLWQDADRRTRGFGREEFCEPGKGRPSSLWWSESLVRWKVVYDFGPSVSTLFVQELLVLFLRFIVVSCAFFPFFSMGYAIVIAFADPRFFVQGRWCSAEL